MERRRQGEIRGAGTGACAKLKAVARPGRTSDCPDNPDNVAPPAHHPRHDSLNALAESDAGIATADPRADGNEEGPAPAVGHIDAPDQSRVVIGEGIVEGVEDGVRQARMHHETKMADPGR
jgi:hypothetical protein